MSWFNKIFGGKKAAVETAELIKKQAEDPAFLHRINWIAAYGKGDFAKALDEASKALSLSPDNADYLTNRGMTHYSMRNYLEAHADISAALKNNPTHKGALDFTKALKTEAGQRRDQARDLARKNNLRGALDLLNNAAKIDPDSPMTFFFRGTLHAQLGDFPSAINDINHTLKLDPQYPKGVEILQAITNLSKEQK